MNKPVKSINGGNVIVSSPRMHEMGARITTLLNTRGVPFSHIRANCPTFACGEPLPHIPTTVRGEHVFLLHQLQWPNPCTALMSMLLTADALLRASVSGITVVAPFMSFQRQDRKPEPRSPISARVTADLIETNSKIERIITMDMHADQEQGFFSIPVDNLNARVVQEQYLREKFDNDFRNVVVVAPDVGGTKRSRRLAARLGKKVRFAIIDKQHTGPNETEVIGFVGASVKGRDVVINDDIIDTGGTIRGAVAEMFRRKARSVTVLGTHILLSKRADEKFRKDRYNLVGIPTIPRPKAYLKKNASWLTFLSIDELLANAIHEASIVGGSVSKLTD